MMARSTRDGAFTFRRLPPGEYFVAAVDPVIEGEWEDPNLLESLVYAATRLAVAEGQKQFVTAKQIVR